VPTTTDRNAPRQTASPALFTHQPRPPETGGGVHNWQRRFGGFHVIEKSSASYDSSMSITVLRRAHEDQASIEVRMNTSDLSSGDIAVTLTADQLQRLACALLDACYDLRTHSPAQLSAGAAS